MTQNEDNMTKQKFAKEKEASWGEVKECGVRDDMDNLLYEYGVAP